MQNQQLIQQEIAQWCGLLKKHRILAGLSQREVGEKMAKLQNREKAFGRQYINNIESGRGSIGLDVFFRYCTAVGARPVLQLLDEKEWIQFSKKSTEKGLTEFS